MTPSSLTPFPDKQKATPSHDVAPDGKPWPSQLAHLSPVRPNRSVAELRELVAKAVNQVWAEFQQLHSNHPARAKLPASITDRVTDALSAHFGSDRAHKVVPLVPGAYPDGIYGEAQPPAPPADGIRGTQ